MPQKIINVAVSGLSVSQAYLPNYINPGESRLAIVHDLNPDLARKTAEQFNTRWTTDFNEVLNSDADMLDISTPNHFHAQQAIAAMNAGKHVLCQKPMARSVTECRQMIDTAKRTGKTLGMMMTMLNNVYLNDLRQAIAQGYLGKISMVRTRVAHLGLFHTKDKNHWRAKRENVGCTGGSFIQLVIHHYNLALWLLQQDVESVIAFSDNLYCQHSMEGDDTTAAVARLNNGILMTMESGYASCGSSLEIFGTEGEIRMNQGSLQIVLARDFHGQTLHYTRPKPGTTIYHPLPQPVEVAPRVNEDWTRDIEHAQNQNRQFIRALLENRPAPVPAEIGLRDIAIAQAVHQSAELGRRVTLHEILNQTEPAA